MADMERDNVNHPQLYISEDGVEVIDVIKAFTADLQGIEATDTGNIIKYICRWKHKNGIEDLKKARWYLDHLIDILEYEKKTSEGDCFHCAYYDIQCKNLSCTEGVRKWFQDMETKAEVDDVMGEQISLDEAMEIYLNGQNKL